MVRRLRLVTIELSKADDVGPWLIDQGHPWCEEARQLLHNPRRCGGKLHQSMRALACLSRRHAHWGSNGGAKMPEDRREFVHAKFPGPRAVVSLLVLGGDDDGERARGQRHRERAPSHVEGSAGHKTL